MRLYIDKENLISLIESRDNECFEDCARVIRKDLDVQYNFSKQEILSNEYLMSWFSQFGQGIKGKQSFVPENSAYVVPPRPLKSNFYTRDSNALTSIYLLNDAHICDVVQQKSCVLIGKVGDEIRILSSLLIENKETLSSKIDSWKNYCPVLPLTDIIICDNFYFKDKETYSKNDNELIKALAGIPHQSPVNVVVYTKIGEVDASINLDNEQKTISRVVKEVTGSKKSSVTIVLSYSTHDRCIITNYYRIKHGSCFHLKGNNLKPDVITEIKSHVNRNNEKITQDLIETFQKIIDKLPDCIGDKKSNFLSFPLI